MFQEQIQKVKKKRKLMCMIGIPFCLLFVGTGWGITRMFDEKDFPFWIVQILFVVLGLCVAGYIIKLYTALYCKIE